MADSGFHAVEWGMFSYALPALRTELLARADSLPGWRDADIQGSNGLGER